MGDAAVASKGLKEVGSVVMSRTKAASASDGRGACSTLSTRRGMVAFDGNNLAAASGSPDSFHACFA